MTLRPFIRGAAVLLVAGGAALALAVGDAAAPPPPAAAPAQALQPAADPITLERQALPLQGTPDFGEAEARFGAGQPVGQVGCAGSCWGDHLHLELRPGRGPEGPPRDPLPLLRALDAG